MNQLTILLAALAAVIQAGFLMWGGLTDSETRSGRVAEVKPIRIGLEGKGSEANTASVQPLNRYPQTTSRPVFFEGRRYPEREVAKQAALPTSSVQSAANFAARSPNSNVQPPPVVKVTAQGLQLKGLQLGGDADRALIEDQSKSFNWLEVGDTVQLWRVDEILDDAVVLRQGEQEARLSLYR